MIVPLCCCAAFLCFVFVFVVCVWLVVAYITAAVPRMDTLSVRIIDILVLVIMGTLIEPRAVLAPTFGCLASRRRNTSAKICRLTLLPGLGPAACWPRRLGCTRTS